MKRQCLVIALSCAALFLAACNKHDLPNAPKDKRFLVKELTYDGRNYAFRYDHAGLVTAISVTGPHGLSYVYQVARHGKKIDSVSLIRNGAVESTNADIRYDHKGRIISYRYYLYAIFQPYPAVITLTYSPAGNIATITRTFGGFTDPDTLSFDHQNDLQRWTQDRQGMQRGWTFVADEYKNPLHYIDDLFVMFVEETFFWEFIFSEHNTIRKLGIEDDNADITTFQNHYDAYQRLAQKNISSSTTGLDSLVFTYLH